MERASLRWNPTTGVLSMQSHRPCNEPQTKQTGLSRSDYQSMFPGVTISIERVHPPFQSPQPGFVMPPFSPRLIPLTGASHQATS